MRYRLSDLGQTGTIALVIMGLAAGVALRSHHALAGGGECALNGAEATFVAVRRTQGAAPLGAQEFWRRYLVLGGLSGANTMDNFRESSFETDIITLSIEAEALP